MGEGMIPSESRMRENRTSGLMSGGEETQAMTETEAPAQGESRRPTATPSVYSPARLPPTLRAPWKGAFSLRVRNPLSNCRFGW